MAAMGERLLAGPAASMRAKLTEKGRCRPTAMIRPLLPAGVSSLEGVPMLDAHGAGNADGPTEAALQKYLDEIRHAAKIFARCNHKEGTLAEHDTYVVWIDAWARLSGFGQYVVIDETVRARAERSTLACSVNADLACARVVCAVLCVFCRKWLESAALSSP